MPVAGFILFLVVAQSPQVSVDRITSARTPEEAAAAHVELLQNADATQLDKLATNPNHGIAIRAVWEKEIVRTVSEAQRTPSEANMARFLDCVKTNLGVPIPSYWQDAVQRSRLAKMGSTGNVWKVIPGAHPPMLVGFDSEGRLRSVDRAGHSPSPYHYVDFREGSLLVPRNTTLLEEAGNVILKVDDRTHVISPRIVRRDQEGALSALIEDDGTCFIAFHSSFAREFWLLRIDEQGEEVWRSKVWASGFDEDSSGSSKDFVWLVRHGNAVVVFGVSGFACYIETFDLAGANTGRFVNSYWHETLAAVLNAEAAEMAARLDAAPPDTDARGEQSQSTWWRKSMALLLTLARAAQAAH